MGSDLPLWVVAGSQGSGGLGSTTPLGEESPGPMPGHPQRLSEAISSTKGWSQDLKRGVLGGDGETGTFPEVETEGRGWGGEGRRAERGSVRGTLGGAGAGGGEDSATCLHHLLKEGLTPQPGQEDPWDSPSWSLRASVVGPEGLFQIRFSKSSIICLLVWGISCSSWGVHGDGVGRMRNTSYRQKWGFCAILALFRARSPSGF